MYKNREKRKALHTFSSMFSMRDGRVARVYRGTLVHSTRDEALCVLTDRVLGVNEQGKIAFIEDGQNVGRLSCEWGFESTNVEQLGSHEFFMPGMVDTHIHAPQYQFAGTHLDLPLLDWLKEYTFPVESRYENLDFAKDVYTKVVKRTLRNGTTTACYFATIHTDASLLLGEIADKFGQRALVGKVCMDKNTMVPQYKEPHEECQKETVRFVSELLKKEYALVKPVVTPRFALSCSAPLLKTLGMIAKNNELHIQSHISENKEEVQLVKEQFPDSLSYTDVYLKHDLLTEKVILLSRRHFAIPGIGSGFNSTISTVMAHGCHLTDEELKIFHEKGAAISHCPNSNISLVSGMLNVRKVLHHKVKLGLGTDVAGGYSISMLDAIRKAIDTSKALCIQDCKNQPLTFKEAFRLATLGGSEALSLDNSIGNFEVGKDFDALRVNMCVPGSPVDVFSEDNSEVLLEKFLNLGDDRNIVEVYVAGKQVIPLPDPE